MSNLNKIGQLVQVLFQLTVRKLKTIFLVSGIFPGKVDSGILLGFECTINPQNLIKIVRAIFQKFEIFNFFLCELPLILGIARKRKEKAEDICKTTPDVEVGQLVQVLFQLTVRKLKNIFLVSGIFPGKADSVILMGFECTINPQNLIKIVRAIFEKFEI